MYEQSILKEIYMNKSRCWSEDVRHVDQLKGANKN